MPFKANVGKVDRVLRVLVGGLFIYLGFFAGDIIANQMLRYILGGLGIINVATALIGFCPIYTLANINTSGHGRS